MSFKNNFFFLLLKINSSNSSRILINNSVTEHTYVNLCAYVYACMLSAFRFKIFSNLLGLFKITSLVCNMHRGELCSDHCWDNVTPHDRSFKMSFKLNAPPEASLLRLLQFCSSISSATLSSAPHRWMISRTIINSVCVYLHLLCVRLCDRHHRECRREERMKEFFLTIT